MREVKQKTELEISYRRNAGISYMILPQISNVSSFEEEMLLHNEIPVLLSFFSLQADGCKQFWYDITSKKSIRHLFEQGEISKEQLCTLLLRILEAYKKTGEYLIADTHLYLTEDTVFVTGNGLDAQVYLCFTPDDTEGMVAALMRLYEFLMPEIDSRDEELVGVIYEGYQQLSDGSFSFLRTQEMLRDILYPTGERKSIITTGAALPVKRDAAPYPPAYPPQKRDAVPYHSAYPPQKRDAVPYSSAYPPQSRDAVPYSSAYPPQKQDTTPYPSAFPNQSREQPRAYDPFQSIQRDEERSGFRFRGVRTSRITGSQTEWPQNEAVEETAVIPEKKKKGFWERRKEKEKETDIWAEQEGKDHEQLLEELYGEEEKELSIGERVKGFFGHLLQGFQKEKEQYFPPKDLEEDLVYDPGEHLPSPTVLLSNDTGRCYGRLVYEGSKGEKDYILDKAEYHIGSRDKRNEVLLHSVTVSRHHARIWKEGEDYYLEDLNSTNGTYVNGEIVNINEPRKLCYMDQIAFADVEYRMV